MSQHTLMAAVNAAANDKTYIIDPTYSAHTVVAATPKAEEEDCPCKGEEGCECDDSYEKDAAKLTAAVTAERNRILAIQASAFPGQEELVTSLINSGATAGDAAMAFNKDHKAKLAGVMKALDADEAKVKGLRSEYSPANGPAEASETNKGLTGEPKWKADYATSAALQTEFPTEAGYLAYMRAEARGGIRVLKSKSA